ncbi:sulfurtransferase [Psychroserpens sp. SPM9]|uniref:sulfurtransferase n=1 Tax=Psychroserpens sp. SPM9 TaxID=2975598 RepID=UPI0021A39B7C|nr:sulfurtransferase [Psychroserpens sp. SPM9]MDG5491957.1 sulfurtransferase [Psychroserpens sp. SPM9]
MLKNGRFISPIVSCKWLNDNRHLKALIILDARVTTNDTSSEETFIPNSRYFDIKGKFSDLKAEFPNTIPSPEQFQNEARQLGINSDSLIVVYDDKGMYWSPRVWWLFKTFGFDNVAVLNGGLPEWVKNDYETTSALLRPHWHPGNFSAVYQSERMCFFDDIINLSEDDSVMLLDARSKERFQCEVPEPRVGLRSGTIPKSKNLPYTRLFDGYCLKPKSDLKAVFDTFKIGDNSLIFSCGSGITACILALAAEISDYKNLTVYDGSWTEYGTLTT